MSDSEIRRILVAEDDPDIRRMIRESLVAEAPGMRIHSLEVVEAADGLAAIDRASLQQFHCVITDLKMPKATGDEFLRAMQSNPLNANTPTLVISGYLQDEFRDFADTFTHIKMIPKPFEPTELARAALQEVKLGRMDDRISIHLVQPFIESIQGWLAKDAKLVSQALPPLIKRAGEALAGDFHCNLTLSSGLSRARFCLSFDETILHYVQNKLAEIAGTQWSKLSLEEATRVTCHLLFERAQAGAQMQMGGNPQLVVVDVYRSTDPLHAAERIGTTGVTVTVETQKGNVYAGAFSISGSRRV